MNDGRRGWVGIDRRWLTNPALDDTALRLMLWLDSHTDEFLAHVNYTRAAETLGWGRNRVKRAAATLEDLGLVSTVQVDRPGGGTVTAFTLHQSAWSDRDGGPPSTSAPDNAGPRQTSAVVHDDASAVVHDDAPTTRTTNTEEHSQELPSSHAAAIVDTFDAWWARYPRRVSKLSARTAWAKMTPDEHTAALDAIDDHVRMWIAEGRGTATIPYPATWLRARSWDDELSFVPERRSTPAAGSSLDRIKQANQGAGR